MNNLENRERRNKNIGNLTGRWRGEFLQNGVPRGFQKAPGFEIVLVRYKPTESTLDEIFARLNISTGESASQSLGTPQYTYTHRRYYYDKRGQMHMIERPMNCVDYQRWLEENNL